ncbi:MAG: HAD-IIIA family hydrolase [Bacteroidales bacterium]|nr:HAD-IIIA family hydrolase [Bacteroidales bacterium]
MDWNSKIDKSWTLFLDRDGVVNTRLVDDYVKNINEFEFMPGVLDAFKVFAEKFGKIIIVTNQQGVGKGIMTMDDVVKVHDFMLKEIENQKGRVDAIYVCPQLKSDPDNFRKPSPKMAYMAQHDFPEIDLEKSIMVGDMNSDLEFGKNCGMYTVFVGDEPIKIRPDAKYNSLFDFAKILK